MDFASRVSPSKISVEAHTHLYIPILNLLVKPLLLVCITLYNVKSLYITLLRQI